MSSKVDTADIISKFSRKDGDTGSPEVQIALATHHITNLTEHMKEFRKDHQSRRGLLAYVSKRKKMLRYLMNSNPVSCKELMEKLKIKKI